MVIYLSLRGDVLRPKQSPIELGIASSQRALLAMTYSLRLNRIACIDPRLQAAEDGCDFCITVLQKDKRRTGAGVFILSGAIGDDPLVFREIQPGWVDLKLTQLDVDRTFDVTRLIGWLAPHIHDDRCAAFEGGFCFFDTHAWDARFTRRNTRFLGRSGWFNDHNHGWS